jgi:hypothetical protein
LAKVFDLFRDVAAVSLCRIRTTVKLRTQMHLRVLSCAASPEFAEMPKSLAKKNGNFSVPLSVPFANISSDCGIKKSGADVVLNAA